MGILTSPADQLAALKQSRSTGFAFRDGVKHHRMSCGKRNPEIRFSIAPAMPDAFLQENAEGRHIPSDPAAWTHHVDLSTMVISRIWAQFPMARFLGHGASYKGGGRVDIVSAQTFDPSQPCPVDMLYRAAKASAEWSYLVQDVKVPDPGRDISAPLSAPSMMAAMNVVLAEKPGEIMLGLFTPTALLALIGEGGLIWQPSPIASADPELVKEHPWYQFNVGDFTNPGIGTQLVLSRPTNGYQVAIATGIGGASPPANHLPAEMLSKRYVLADPHQWLNPTTVKSNIEQLVDTFRGRNARGWHEHELLADVFQGMEGCPRPPERRTPVPTGPPVGAVPTSAPASAPPPIPAGAPPPPAAAPAAHAPPVPTAAPPAAHAPPVPTAAPPAAAPPVAPPATTLTPAPPASATGLSLPPAPATTPAVVPGDTLPPPPPPVG